MSITARHPSRRDRGRGQAAGSFGWPVEVAAPRRTKVRIIRSVTNGRALRVRMKLKQTTLKFGVSDSVKEAKMHDSGLAARVTAALMAQQGRDGGSAGVGTAARLEQDQYETLQCSSGLKATGEDGVRVETARVASALITHPGKDEDPGPGLDERGQNGVQEDARRTSRRPRRENGECTPWWIVEGNHCETSRHPPLVESEETTRATRPALAPPRVLMTSPAAFTAFTVVIKMCSNPM